MIIILAFWLAVIVYGISIPGGKIKPLNIEHTLALRGICAVEIMIGHIGLSTGSILLYPNRKAGILFVGIFFMLSGYGLAYGTEHKENYHKRFLVNRFAKLMIPAYIVYVISILIQAIFLQNTILNDLFNIYKFFITLNWYVWEQLFFYIIYWIADRFIPKYKELVIGICSVILIVGAFILKVDNPWYGSTLCFLLGLCYYKLEKRDYKLTSIQKWSILVILGIILGISMVAFFALGNDSIIGNPLARNLASVCFCTMAIMVLKEIKIGNKISYFLGTCSYEIFLIHPYVLSILGVFIKGNTILYGGMTIIVTIFLSYIVHRINKKIFEWNRN